MRQLAMALAAVTLLAAATPASAQGLYVGVGDGYGYYGGRGWWGGGREVYAYRPYYRPYGFYRRYHDPYVYPHRSWWGGY